MKAHNARLNRLSQGDIFRDVEDVQEKNGIITVSKVVFPFSVVLTQDCDLAQDPRCGEETGDGTESKQPHSQDKWLLSVLLVPMYNALHLFDGTHLSELKMEMQKFNSYQKGKIKINEIARYHYIKFTDETPMPPIVVDFKHYFSANAEYLKRMSEEKLVCQIPPLFREDLSDRFAAYFVSNCSSSRRTRGT